MTANARRSQDTRPPAAGKTLGVKAVTSRQACRNLLSRLDGIARTRVALASTRRPTHPPDLAPSGAAAIMPPRARALPPCTRPALPRETAVRRTSRSRRGRNHRAHTYRFTTKIGKNRAPCAHSRHVVARRRPRRRSKRFRPGSALARRRASAISPTCPNVSPLVLGRPRWISQILQIPAGKVLGCRKSSAKDGLFPRRHARRESRPIPRHRPSPPAAPRVHRRSWSARAYLRPLHRSKPPTMTKEVRMSGAASSSAP